MTEGRAKILTVDDELENLEYLGRILGRKYEVVAAASGEEALAAVGRTEFSVIVADHRMPGMSGVEFLARARELAPETIRIILTGFADLDDTIDAINRAAVSWYLRKPIRAAEIEQAVTNAVEINALRVRNRWLLRTLEERNRQLEEKEKLLVMDLDQKSAEILAMNRRLEEMVVRDGLTGLFNHRYFQERTEQELHRAARFGHTLSLAFFDLDHFKAYNDANGHPQGDEALVTLATILTSGSRAADVVARVRRPDVVARYGGEEFVMLLPETGKPGAAIMAERLRAAVEAHPFAGEKSVPGGRLTVSVGVATFPDDAATRPDLIARADEAVYRAKATGRNRVCVYAAI